MRAGNCLEAPQIKTIDWHGEDDLERLGTRSSKMGVYAWEIGRCHAVAARRLPLPEGTSTRLDLPILPD